MKFGLRNIVPLLFLGISLILLALHTAGRWPTPGAYDLAQLAGNSRIEVVGRILDIPQTRWSQTRFLLEACAEPLNAFCGRVQVQCDFPFDVTPGETLRLAGYLSRPRQHTKTGFEEANYLAAQGVFARLRVFYPESLETRSPAWLWRKVLWNMRCQFDSFWRERLTSRQSAILLGVTIGARDVLEPSFKEACLRAGVYHVLVASGQNVAMVVALVFFAGATLRLSRRSQALLAIPFVWAYAGMVGPEPPVQRAACMATTLLCATIAGRDLPVFAPLFLAGLVLLISDPCQLMGASFQLSFGATAALLATMPWRATRWEKWPKVLRPVVQLLMMHLIVEVALIPLLGHYFGRLSLAGIGANLVIVPMSGLLMGYAVLAGSLGLILPSGGPEALAAPARWLTESMTFVIRESALLPGAMVPLPRGPLWVWVVYGGIVVCLFVKLNGISLSDGKRRYFLCL